MTTATKTRTMLSVNYTAEASLAAIAASIEREKGVIRQGGTDAERLETAMCRLVELGVARGAHLADRASRPIRG